MITYTYPSGQGALYVKETDSLFSTSGLKASTNIDSFNTQILKMLKRLFFNVRSGSACCVGNKDKHVVFHKAQTVFYM